MIELLADPTSAPLWGVFLMALGMYPFGLMLGAPCSPCCGCALCTGGSVLPETVTVTFSGFTDKSQGPYLCDLEFSACYGSGADGVVTAPGGDPATNSGPITAVSLTDGGSGYAKLGRTSPTVTATGSGSGATLTVTLSQSQDECKVDYWKVKSIAGSGGTGYADDEQVQFTVAAGDTAEEHATARVRTVREEPEVTLSVDSEEGSGADLEAVFAQLAGSPTTWGIDSITVNDGGDLYTRNDTISVAVKSKTSEVVAAYLTIKVTHAEPTVVASLPFSAGTGASLTAVLSPITSIIDGANVWEVESVTVNDGGSGYQQYDTVEVAVSDGSPESSQANAYVWEVDGSGGILSVRVDGGGEYFKGGPISEVLVDDGGQYFKDSGVVESVVVDDGGVYYREDDSIQAYVADVTVTIIQTMPSDGAGASISATVDDDPQSETFGQITALSVDDGGDDYLAWEWVTNDCCGHWLNDKPVVLALAAESNSPTPGGATVAGQFIDGRCLYVHRMCGGWESPFTITGNGAFAGRPAPAEMRVLVGFAGEGNSAVAQVSGLNLADDAGFACDSSWESDEPIESCGGFSWTATDGYGRSITVQPGGTYDEEFQYAGSCNSCCQGYQPSPSEVEVVVADVWNGARPQVIDPATGLLINLPDQSGTYVLSGVNSLQWGGGSAYVSILCYVGFGSHFIENGAYPIEFGGCQYEPCNGCIKKCSVSARVVGTLTLDYDFYNTAQLCSPGYGGGGCADCFTCEPTPLCSPSGKVFNIVRVPRLTHPPLISANAQPAFTLTFQ